MQQVPEYLLIGSGQLASHLSNYFSKLGINHSKWSRNNHTHFNTLNIQDNRSRLLTTLDQVNVVLLCIKDDVIESFLENYPELNSKTIVHFSGAKNIKGLINFHPLMTFGGSDFSLNDYENIPFIDFNEDFHFNDIFPRLKNPTFKIESEKKAFYHSLCVMSGNFTTLLWAKTLQEFHSLGLEANLVKPYMEQVFKNTLSDPINNLSGPIIRNDKGTITKNIAALNNQEDLKTLYQSFINLSQNMELQ